MKGKYYLDSSQLYPTVKFPKEVISNQFEPILNECYKTTLLKKTKKIKFDFSNVTWCDVFELSLLSLWILELKSQNKEIIFKFPIDNSVYNFLRDYRFEEFLDNNNIEKENTGTGKAIPRPTDSRKPYYPLTFFNEDSFKGMLEDLYYGNRLEIVLNDIKDTEIVKSGAIRDIVLKELGDNFFFHGNGRFAHIIVTKFGSVSPEKAKLWAEITLNRVSELEKPFFQKLYGQSFLALVISDKGDGIHKTLVNSYGSDDIVHNKNDKPSECDILEYAFLYHSTRRPIEERIGAIKEIISDKAKDFPPPTGLYRLKEVVRKFHGFLYLRSGSSIICYDFYNNQKNDKPITNKNIKGLNKLTNFGGTQYKVYFPVNIPSRKSTAKSFIFSEKIARPLQYNYLSLKSYFSLETVNNFDKEATKLHELFNEIERNKSKFKNNHGSTLIDFDNEKNISSKALHYLLFEMMQRQAGAYANVGINLSSNIISQFKEIFEIKKRSFIKPLILFDKKFVPYIIGIGSDKEGIFNKLLIAEETQTDEMQDFAGKNTHIFFYNSDTDRYEFIHSSLKIIQTVRNAIRDKMKETILDPLSNIFDKDIKVLIPSGSYCKGYFETYKILENNDWEKAIQTWFKYWMIELRPDYIISISTHIGGIVDKSIDEIKSYSLLHIKHINFKTPIKGIDFIKLILELEKGKKVVIFTDVIGTGSTVYSILEKAQHTEVLKIFTLVNAKPDEKNLIELKGKSFDIESIIKQKLAYYDDLPKGWLYSEICQVDPDTHVLVKNLAKAEGPLWKEIENHKEEINGSISEWQVNNFFEDVVIPTDSVVEGHFTSGDKHMTYLFDIPVIVKSFLDEISEKIVTDVMEHFSKMRDRQDRKITHIFYPEINPGVNEIANRVSSKFPKSIPIPIKEGEFSSYFDQIEALKEIDIVIIIDDAFVSGDTIFRMFDIAERKGAKDIFAYVLIKRGSEYYGRRLEKISQYGHLPVQTRYLADAEIPTYISTDCPICKQSKELSVLIKKVENINLLNDFIRKEINRYSSQPVSVVIEEGRLTPSEGYFPKRKGLLNFRWKLELAKKQPGVKNELARIVRKYKENSTDVLCLFQILAKEKYIFLLDEKLRKTIFYETFTQDIISACRFFSEQIENLTDEDSEGVLSILRAFDEDYFIDSLSDVLKRTIPHYEKFLRIIMHSLLSEKAREYPTRIKSIFSALQNSNIDDAGIKDIINKLSIYWENSEREINDSRSQRLKCFCELTGGIFHEIRHLKDDIISCTDKECVDTDKISNIWYRISENIKESLQKLRIFIGNNLPSELVTPLDSKIYSLNYKIYEGNETISEFKNSENIKSSIENIKQIVLRVYELIYDRENGIRKKIEDFKTDIKSTVSAVALQQSNDLSSKNIKCEKEFPDDACVVFGDEVSILGIFQNLIENVWKHSNANLLKIKAIIDAERKNISICFLDNGKGIDEKEYGEGLKKVDKFISSYCGVFEIFNLTEGEYYKDGFRTIAMVKLPFFDRRSEIK